MDEALGFYNTRSFPDLLNELELFSYAVLFIGLIFDVLLLIFVIVAILLVFSLLLISVETKAFEFGVMRLVGLTKRGFVAMVITQAGMFVLPAVISAFIFSFPLIYLIYSWSIADKLGYMPSVTPSGRATLNALFLGVIIPLLSAIIPVRRGLRANITEALDATRSRAKGSEVTIVNKKLLNVFPFLL